MSIWSFPFFVSFLSKINKLKLDIIGLLLAYILNLFVNKLLNEDYDVINV